MPTKYVVQRLVPEPYDRCSICGVLPRSGIVLLYLDGIDICLRCVRDRARGAKMTGDSLVGRPAFKR